MAFSFREVGDGTFIVEYPYVISYHEDDKGKFHVTCDDTKEKATGDTLLEAFIRFKIATEGAND